METIPTLQPSHLTSKGRPHRNSQIHVKRVHSACKNVHSHTVMCDATCNLSVLQRKMFKYVCLSHIVKYCTAKKNEWA